MQRLFDWVECLCKAAYDLGASDATEEIAGVYPLDTFSMDRVNALAQSRKVETEAAQ